MRRGGRSAPDAARPGSLALRRSRPPQYPGRAASTRSSRTSLRAPRARCRRPRGRRPVREHGTAQQSAAAGNAAHHRADWHADDVGDLLVLESVDVVELDRDGDLLGNLSERRAHLFAGAADGALVEEGIPSTVATDDFLVRDLEAGN